MTKNNLSKCLAWLLENNDQLAKANLEHLDVPPPTTTDDPIAAGIISNDAEAVGSQETMARLQLAPQSTTKPRLLTQPKPLPTPSASDSQRNSSPSAGHAVSRRHEPGSRRAVPIKTVATNYDDSVFDIDDIDAILEEDPHNFTTSSYEDFGTPRRLWTETAATRPEPFSTKQGKKRKSEEYLEDVLRQSPVRKVRSPMIKNASSHIASNSKPKSMKIEQNRGFETPSRQTSPVRPLKQSNTMSSRGHPSDDECLAILSPQPPDIYIGTKQRPARAIVPDSDEEDDGARYLEPVEHSPARTQVQQASLQSFVRSSPFKIEESPPSQSATHEAAPSTQQKPKSNGITISRQCQASSSAIESTPGINTPCSSNPRLSESEKALVAQFMRVSSGQHDAIMQHLDHSKREISKKIVDHIYEHEFYSEELKETMQTIKSKINAVEELSTLKRSHRELCLKRDSLKDEIVELVHSDGDIDQKNEDLKRIKVAVDSKEAELHRLIIQAGWPAQYPAQMQGDSNQEDRDSRPTHQKNVLVTSTQHTRGPLISLQVQPSNIASQSRTTYDSTQPVFQTPTASRLDLREDFDDHAHHHFVDSRDFVPRAVTTNTATEGRLGHTPLVMPTNAHWMNHDEQQYTRTMGSPMAPVSFADEFDDVFGDEDDILGAAQAFEDGLRHDKRNHSVPRSQRPPLSNVSGNVRREPPRQEDTVPLPPVNQHPWTKDVITAMRKRFHLQGFRHNQLEAINATLAGKDAFVLMPTGGGKSLCYQLPSIIQSGRSRGVTVVISPLLSLMQDQVDHLQKLKIQAYLVNGQSTKEQKKYIFQALRDHQPEKFIQLLYITPEMISKNKAMVDIFMALHRNNKLARIVIDEAHCVSQWGHDFRPDYKELGTIRQQFPGVPVMALTATATETVKVDVIHHLCMDNCEVFHQSFNRPNLSYEIREKAKGTKTVEAIAETINLNHRDQSGIVYCLSRKECERVAEQLRTEHSISAMHYHAGMESEERIKIQKEWQAGRHNVIVATIAFGMGIDKPDVRYVVHQTIPKSLEGYYQETGRAGRDGQPSQCYLYYGYGDTTQLRRMIKSNKDASWEQQERQLQMLRNVVQFCENKSDCRRVQVLAYFNEHFDREQCNDSCDNCRSDSTFEIVDFTDHAKHVISLVQEVQNQQVTLLHCVDVYRGSSNKKITDCGHKELDQYGMGSHLDRGDVERLFYRLLSEDGLEEWNVVNRRGFATQYVRIGPAARDFKSGRRKVEIQVRASPRGKSKGKAPGNISQKKSHGTGVRTANDCPASTNVSSPIQSRVAAQRGRASRQLAVLDDDSDDDEYFESDLAAFAPVRQAGGPIEASPRRKLGPPITSDETISRLSTVQRNVLDEFMREAKRYIGAVVLDKGLKQRPIADSILRQMGIELPRSMDALSRIRGLTQEKIRLYGPKILELIENANNTIELVAQSEQAGAAHSSRTAIVEITDDEDVAEAQEDSFDDDDLDADDWDSAQSSHYFSGPGYSGNKQALAVPSRASSAVANSKNVRRSTGSQSRATANSKTSRGRAFTKRNSGGKTSGPSKITKKSRGSGARSTGNTSRNSASSSKSKGAATSSGRNGTLIGMMPT